MKVVEDHIHVGDHDLEDHVEVQVEVDLAVDVADEVVDLPVAERKLDLREEPEGPEDQAVDHHVLEVAVLHKIIMIKIFQYTFNIKFSKKTIKMLQYTKCYYTNLKIYHK